MKQLWLGFQKLVGLGRTFFARPGWLAALWVLACGAFVYYSLTDPGRMRFFLALGLLLVMLALIILRLRFLKHSFPAFLQLISRLLVRLVWLTLLSMLAGSVFYLGFLMPHDLGPKWGPLLIHLSMVILVVFVLTVATVWVFRGPKWLLDSTRFYVWATVFVFSMVVLYYSAEKWRGKRLWAAVQREMVARGEKPGFAFLLPPPVPEEQDAAKAPIFAPLSDYSVGINGEVFCKDRKGYEHLRVIKLPIQKKFWTASMDWLRQEPTELMPVVDELERKGPFIVPPATNLSSETALLEYLGKYAIDLEAIRLASQRPYARFKLTYTDGSLAVSPHRDILNNSAAVFDYRAEAGLKSGRTSEACEDVLAALRLLRLECQQVSLVDFNTAVGMTLLSLQPIWEGMAARQWTDAQIATLQAQPRPSQSTG